MFFKFKKERICRNIVAPALSAMNQYSRYEYNIKSIKRSPIKDCRCVTFIMPANNTEANAVVNMKDQWLKSISITLPDHAIARYVTRILFCYGPYAISPNIGSIIPQIQNRDTSKSVTITQDHCILRFSRSEHEHTRVSIYIPTDAKHRKFSTGGV